MRNIITLVLLLVAVVANAQVHVRGYHRKDGTYVQSHERTRPDGILSNNYSYPGNYNPNTGSITPGGGNSTISSSSYYSNGSYSSTSSSTNKSTSSINKRYVNVNSLNIRSGPSTSTSILYPLNQGDDVEVIETFNSKWKKVRIYRFTIGPLAPTEIVGYVASEYLSSDNPSAGSIYNYSNGSNNLSNTGSQAYASTNSNSASTSNRIYLPEPVHYTGNSNYSNSDYNGSFVWKTTTNRPSIDVNLRSAPHIEASSLYNVPKDAVIYILEHKNLGYFKVYVHGHTGYIAEGLLDF